MIQQKFSQCLSRYLSSFLLCEIYAMWMWNFNVPCAMRCDMEYPKKGAKRWLEWRVGGWELDWMWWGAVERCVCQCCSRSQSLSMCHHNHHYDLPAGVNNESSVSRHRVGGLCIHVYSSRLNSIADSMPIYIVYCIQFAVNSFDIPDMNEFA